MAKRTITEILFPFQFIRNQQSARVNGTQVDCGSRLSHRMAIPRTKIEQQAALYRYFEKFKSSLA